MYGCSYDTLWKQYEETGHPIFRESWPEVESLLIVVLSILQKTTAIHFRNELPQLKYSKHLKM